MNTQPGIKALLEQVDEAAIVHDLSELVSTPSVNPFDDPVSASCRELEAANLYEAMMQRAGMETFRRDVATGRPNIFGRIRGSGEGPCVMLAGHLDTVGISEYIDPFSPVIKDGKLYGRGSCDMKAGLAAFIEVARIISQNKISLKGDLLIAGIVDEEHLMIGSRDISEHGPIPEFAIVGEPTELDVHHVHKGQFCMHIKTHGQACHSSIPEQGINAIQHMAKILQAFENYNEELKSRPADPICGHASFNPGVIRGGEIASSVPDYCELEVDRRVIAGETIEQVIEEYHARIRPLQNATPNFKYEIGDPTLVSYPLNTPANSGS